MSLQIARHKDRVRSKAYLEFIASFPCLKCGNRDSQCHHATSRKWSSGSDLKCVPLCAVCHAGVSSREDFTDAIQAYQAMFRRRNKLPAGDFEAAMLESGVAYRKDGSKRKNRKEFKKKFTNPFEK
ncbi:MAG: hypothetical protein KGJ13_04355 [Patescibacteria group bacterium]|nr:hypothetical protein [Patescibacteria group bacterium]